MKEAELKRSCEAYLALKQNLAELVYFRLNAGAFQTQSGRWAKGCRAGTADLLVIKKDYFEGTLTYYARCIFVELKGEHGKQSPAQKEFEERVLPLGAEYYLVKSFEELEAILD